MNAPTIKIAPDWVSDCGRVTLYCGDCLDILPTLEPGSVDAVVTDPPYGMDYQSARRIDSERFSKIANDTGPFVWWAMPAAKIVKDGGCVLCFCRWDDAEAFRLSLGWAGLTVKSQLVWDRGNHGMGDLSGAPAPRHDTVWFATQNGFTLPGRRPQSVLTHMRLCGDALTHPNEKPVPLMVELCGDYSPTTGTILDPFMGSGATGVACVKTGRRFIGIELEPKYFKIAKRRIKEELEANLFAETAQ